MKTLHLMIARGVTRFATLTLLLFPLALIPARAEANTIALGDIEFSGSFTLNPAYNFNQPTAQPFGSFGDLTVIQSSGVFAAFIDSGDVLVMNTPYFLSPPLSANISDEPLAGQMVWSIDGYTMNTTWDVITGPDSGRNGFGLFDLSGHHRDHALTALGAYGYWDFTAPPYDISNFTQPVTGPIHLTIHEAFNNGQDKSRVAAVNLTVQETSDTGRVVPEPSSLLLLSLGFVGFVLWQWRRQSHLLDNREA
jgi:hypothetical protein